MSGPWRIVVVASGDEWCDECYSDALDGTDRDPSMYVQERRDHGLCTCCGAEVAAGILLDADRYDL